MESPLESSIRGATLRLSFLLAKPYRAPATIKRMLGAAKAAVKWAWKNGELDRPVPFLNVAEGPGRERVLSVEELARLWSAEMPEHLRVFVALLIGTAGRPGGYAATHPLPVRPSTRNDQSEPAGPCSDKEAPARPAHGRLVAAVDRSFARALVAYRGKPVRRLRARSRPARCRRLRAGCDCLHVRHTVATELMVRGVPELEIATVMGHRMPNSRTTGRYLHVAPDRLASARKALDDLASSHRPGGIPADGTENMRASCVLVPSGRAAIRR